MKKSVLTFLTLAALSTASATDFSFDKSYNLKMPTNAERIGAIVELKDYFDINPKLSNLTTEINNLSFNYKGLGKSTVKAKICMRVGKLAFFNERLDKATGRVESQVVPRLLNKNQSELRDLIQKFNSDVHYSLTDLNNFCEGEIKLDAEEIREKARAISKALNDSSINISYHLKKDELLIPQDSDLYIEYVGAASKKEAKEQNSEKECSFTDLF